MKNINTTLVDAIKAVTRLDQFEVTPFLLGEQSLTQWVNDNRGKTKTTSQGKEVSVLSSATWHPNLQRAINALTLSVKLAVATRQLPWIKAAGVITTAHRRAELLSAAIAAHRGHSDEMLFPLAGINVKTEEGSFDAFKSDKDDPYSEEELLEMGLGWDQIEEFLELQKATQDARPEAPRSGEGSVSGAEGWYRTTLHTTSQVADLQLNKLQFGEWMAAKAIVSTLAWPTGPDWVAFMNRVVLMWEAKVQRIRSTNEQIREENSRARGTGKKPKPELAQAVIDEMVNDELEKQAKRGIDIQDLTAKPLHVRWTVNHLARRAWRDTQMLKRQLERYQARVDQLVELDYLEERYGPDSPEFKARIGRINMGEAAEQTRSASFLGYLDVLREEEVGVGELDRPHVRKVKDQGEDLFLLTRGAPVRRYGADGIYFVGTNEIRDRTESGIRLIDRESVVRSTPFVREMAWASACVENTAEALRIASAMYKHLRAMDEALACLWEIAIEGQDAPTMPPAPPVYWNLKGFYLTEEAAQAALAEELQEATQQRLLSQDDAIMAAVAGLSGHELMV